MEEAFSFYPWVHVLVHLDVLVLVLVLVLVVLVLVLVLLLVVVMMLAVQEDPEDLVILMEVQGVLVIVLVVEGAEFPENEPKIRILALVNVLTPKA